VKPTPGRQPRECGFALSSSLLPGEACQCVLDIRSRGIIHGPPSQRVGCRTRGFRGARERTVRRQHRSPHSERGHVDGGGAFARWPHHRDRSARRVMDAQRRGRAGGTDSRGWLRCAAAGVVAGRPAPCVSGLSDQHLEHLDGQSRRLRAAAGDRRCLRRSRAALVARRHAHRVRLGSQRQL
jgi:hypothetical protein